LLSKAGCRKSTCKQIIEEKIEEIKAHTISLKAKEATIYGVNLCPKAAFRCLKQSIWQFKTGKITESGDTVPTAGFV
jgi:hypothetical protein